jgi:hypothetical protein
LFMLVQVLEIERHVYFLFCTFSYQQLVEYG